MDTAMGHLLLKSPFPTLTWTSCNSANLDTEILPLSDLSQYYLILHIDHPMVCTPVTFVSLSPLILFYLKLKLVKISRQ